MLSILAVIRRALSMMLRRALANAPHAGSDCADLIGSMKGKIKIRRNMLSTGVKWNADSRANVTK